MNKDELAARLLATFLGELDEQVRTMNADLLALEGAPTDGERLKSLFRVAHTLKGAARAAGVPLIDTACHELETLLAQARDGKRVLGAAEFALLFAAADALTEAGQRIRNGQDLADAAIGPLARRLRSPATAPNRPTAAPLRSAPAPLSPPAPPAPPPQTERAGEQVRVDSTKLDGLLAASSQLMVAGDRVTARRGEVEDLHQLAERCADSWTRTDHQVRLALERAGAPAALIHSLHGVRDTLKRLSNDSGRLATAVATDERTLQQSADEVMVRVRQLRLRPFADACEALPRVVRDIAGTSGKEVDLQIEGGSIEVDRAVLDGLREALTHLTRNAIDHGIESPEQRRLAGKPSRGTLRLIAQLRGDRVTVQLSDDGAGLDLSAIRAQLVQRGLEVPADHRDLARALFQGGLSTRATASPISGRGVGLDIVRAAVQRIQGTVDLSTVAGRGTTFVIECPPSLATLRALLVMVGSQVIAIPILNVERLLRIDPGEVRRAEGREVILTDDRPVPLVPLARLLPPLSQRAPTGKLNAVVLGAGGRRVAVVVDELLTEQEVVLRPVRTGPNPLPHIGGAAILGMGRVALVLNPTSLVAAAQTEAALGGSSLAGAVGAGPTRTRILVVDDSITTRSLEQSILESAGYDVSTAVDGSDAWRMLQEQRFDLVVTDVEMPRMDGFELCQTIRAAARFKTLPVILITALETPEHRTRGLAAGADAYIGKSSFDQQNLLEVVRQLAGAR